LTSHNVRSECVVVFWGTYKYMLSY